MEHISYEKTNSTDHMNPDLTNDISYEIWQEFPDLWCVIKLFLHQNNLENFIHDEPTLKGLKIKWINCSIEIF